METQIINTKLMELMKQKQEEILSLAQKSTEKIVKTELALSDFELLLDANISEEEAEKLAHEARRLRKETWQELSARFNGNTDKIQAFVNNF